MSGFIGALLEAWAELRHHKLRVLLSLKMRFSNPKIDDVQTLVHHCGKSAAHKSA